MKKQLLLLILILSIIACNTTKKIEQKLNTGNYELAINDALKKLSSNKQKKSKQASILLLNRAFDKAQYRDLNDISLLKKDLNPENYEQIFNLYESLRNRQEKIKPILPLYYEGNEVLFKFENYNSDIINYKNKTSDYLYSKALTLLNTEDKFNARKAYEDFSYINKINPNYKDVNNRIKEAVLKGKDFVLIQLKNKTQQVIPNRLENELLNISTYGLDDLWTVYHNNKQVKTKYDYDVLLTFKDIILSPEQIKDREITKEKLVKDGFDYVLDTNGNVKKDSLGNDIKKDKFTKVICQYFETRQFKTSTIVASLEFHNLDTAQLIDRFPIESTFLFEHFFAIFKGDKRALDSTLLNYLDNRRVPFPDSEQMVYDTGEDLKLKLKNIITGYNFRN